MAKRPFSNNYNGLSHWSTPPSDEQYKKNFDDIFKKKGNANGMDNGKRISADNAEHSNTGNEAEGS